jgi:hypothetical protein
VQVDGERGRLDEKENEKLMKKIQRAVFQFNFFCSAMQLVRLLGRVHESVNLEGENLSLDSLSSNNMHVATKSASARLEIKKFFCLSCVSS